MNIYSFAYLLWQTAMLVNSIEIVELQGVNFELSLTSYRYLAILFYDDSNPSRDLEDMWTAASDKIQTLPHECEMAKISGNDPELKELIEAYGITIPSIRVFRRGIMSDYRGPQDTDGIAKYIVEDAKPSVQKITSIDELKLKSQSRLKTVVIGIFDADDVAVEDEAAPVEGYSIDAWGQFQAAADSLRGHASFHLITAKDLISSFKLTAEDLPAVYMISSDGDGMHKYSGEILEMNLSEWVLRNSSPAMGELNLSTPSGELYATQFFSSRKLKFILFINHPALPPSIALDHWRDIAASFAGKAIFSYMTQPVSDVLDYFEVDMQKDWPMVVAHQPSNDYKYKSSAGIDITGGDALLEFVLGVVTGAVPKVVKSEPVPKATKGNNVVVAVGSNVVELASSVDKDVLIVAYTPWCSQCRKLLPTYDILGKAVQGEPRIVIAKINVHANDIPGSWGAKSFPALLWFPAKDKPYKKSLPVPRPYWDAGYSLQELVGFVQREGSFDLKTLKIATPEQLGTLAGDEDTARAKYDAEERHFRRNEGREVFDTPLMDLLLGEVVFDGKYWHLAVGGLLALAVAILLVAIVYLKLPIAIEKSKPVKRKDK